METSEICEACLILEYISWHKKDLIYQSYGIALFYLGQKLLSGIISILYLLLGYCHYIQVMQDTLQG